MLMRYNFWDAWNNAFNQLETETQLPRATAQEREGDYILTAELPGISDKDVGLTVNHDSIVLTAKREVTPLKGYDVHRLERGSFEFKRTFSLPRHVDTEKVTAELKDGVLTITAPKAESAKSRRIEVRGVQS